MIDLKYIITGTGRCGTVFMARLLTSVGLPCGHETIFDSDGLDSAKNRLTGLMPLGISRISLMEYQTSKDQWITLPDWSSDLSEIVADSSYMAAPFLSEFDAKVVQVTRNPIKVIDSFVNHLYYFSGKSPTNCWESFIYRTIPELTKEMPPYDRGAMYYVLWNEMIEKRCDLRCKIEDGPQKILDFIEKPDSPHFNQKVNSVIKKNAADRFVLDKIENKEIASRLISKAKEYEYNISSEYLMI